jgi:hypothetical protein
LTSAKEGKGISVTLLLI